MNYCVITTVNKPTKAIEKLYEHFGKNLIIVADKKTPTGWEYNGIIPMREIISSYAPFNHYARKNIGYMEAIRNKASLIYDTDDDNMPNENWKVRTPQVEASESLGKGWYNVYGVLSDHIIWPRGFSLRELKKMASAGLNQFRTSSIQQGLADGEPDVDAVWRLVINKPHAFVIKKSIYVQPQTWCPFNSQSTWWFPLAYPLMYLPVYASFRMTDIWRSFVAQRCLWNLGEGVTFHSPSEVFQDRNEHDLLSDFRDEIPGYLENDFIVQILNDLKLKAGDDHVCANLLTCYQELVEREILPLNELTSVKAWIKDYENASTDLE